MNRINLAHPAEGDVTYIISAEREANGPSGNKANAEAMIQLARELESIRARGWAHNVHPIAGAYCGRPEESLAVVGKDTTELWVAITHLALRYDQESILMITPDGSGTLGFMDGRDPMPIGRMVAVDPMALADLEAYSIIKATGEAFTFA